MNKNSLAFSTLLISGTNLAVRALGFLLRIWLARRLATEALALYQLVFPCFGLLLTLIIGGLPTTLARLCAEPHASPDGILYSAKHLVTRLFCIIGGGALLLAKPICTYFLGAEEAWPVFLLCLPALWFCARSAIYTGYCIGQRRFVPGAVSQLVSQAVRIGITMLLLLNQTSSPTRQAVLTVAGMVCGEAAGVLVLRLFCPAVKVLSSVPPKRLLSFSAPLTVMRLCASGLGAVNASLIPSLLTASGLAREEALTAFATLTGMAMPVVMLGCSLTGALGTGLVPAVSRNTSPSVIGRKAAKALGFALLIGLAFGTVMNLLGRPLGEWVYHRSDVGDCLRLLSPMVLLAGCTTVGTALLNGMGRSGIALRNQLIGHGVQLLLTPLAALPSLRLLGYGIALWTGHTVTLILHLFSCQKRLRGL